ncbi:MAG: LegC family aminotransferase [Candidatus Omnitrophica bacterium]|nr:LegC family aminotransferase [Candidatus Omnitrophota bacterium]
MYKKIHLDTPNIGALEKRYLNNAVDAGFVSTVGPFVTEFEESFAKYLGVKKSVSTQSGTAAMHIALHELGISQGDEVIVPVLTFVATVNPIIYVGAKPIFVDVDRRTWNIEPREIEKSITEKTKAIIPVHLYGNPCDMNEIMRIARKHNLYVIEDATESLGAKYHDKHTGTFGDLGCFSFNGNKVITTGGGGMVVGDNKARLGHIKFLVNQAKHALKEGHHPEIGFNYRMTNIEAALGLAQMNRLSDFLRRKKRFRSIYREELKNVEGIGFQEEYEGAESPWWLNCIYLKKAIDINIVQTGLKELGIPARRVFMPLIELPPYKRYGKGDFYNARNIYEKSLCLPSSTVNSEEDIKFVCRHIKKLLKSEL